MSNLTYALVIMLSLNAVFILAQASILEINPESSFNSFNCEGSMMGALGNCTNQLLSDDDPSSLLPSAESSVNVETGNIFTDAFSGIKTFFLDSLGLRYLVNLLSGPYNILKGIGLPPVFSMSLGTLWYGVTFFLIVAFMFGRDD